MSDDEDQLGLFDWLARQDASRRPRLVQDVSRAARESQRPADHHAKRTRPSTARQRPKAKLLPFPAARRTGEIRRLAEQMQQYSRELGEAHLKEQLQRKAAAMRIRGLTERQIREQIKALEGAVKGQLWQRTFEPSARGTSE
jgi:Family of unknown function (DUF6074)